jgi:uncharacterized protein YndB with AHSA1/START domain
MANPNYYQPDPQLDLVLERVVDVPRELVWTTWTTPERRKPWQIKNMKMNQVVHFEMPAGEQKCMADFYTCAFGWQTKQLDSEITRTDLCWGSV